MPSMIPRTAMAACALVVCTAGLAACGSNGNDSSSTGTGTAGTSPSVASGTDAAIAAKVPAAIKTKGTLTRRRRRHLRAERVHRLRRQDAVEGMDADLAKAIGSDPRPEGRVSRTPRSTAIIPGLASGKYDLGMSSFTDTKEREKTVDFVTYFSAGTSFYVKAAGRTGDHRARRPVRAEGRRREGHDPAARRDGAEQEVHGGGQAGRRRPRSSPTRTAPTSRCRAAAPRSAWPTRRSPPTRSSSPTASSSSSARRTARRPTASRSPRAAGMAKPVLGALKTLMADGSYQAILEEVGRPGRRDHGPEDQRGDRASPRAGMEFRRPPPTPGPTGGEPVRAERSRPSRSATRAAGSRPPDRAALGATARPLDRDQPALRVGARPATTSSRTRSSTGCA